MSIEKPMADVEEETIQRLIRGTIGAPLDRQRGRAAKAFARALGDGAPIEIPEGESPTPEGDAPWASATNLTGNNLNFKDQQRAGELRRLRFWAGMASALAACLAVVVGLQAWMRPAPRTPGPSPTPAVVASVPLMDEVEYTRNVDGPTVIVENAPLRVVRKQTLKRTEWFDPGENARYSVIEPVEQVGYVKLQPY